MSKKPNKKKIPTLKQVDSFAVPEFMLERMEERYKYSPEDAKNLVREAKRMLYLSVRTDDEISPSMKVDDAWHEMLMFTRYYREFSDFIGAFIHHDPTPGPPDGGKTYEKTKKNYQKTFGEKPDPRYWG
jgi:hypothetical protein